MLLSELRKKKSNSGASHGLSNRFLNDSTIFHTFCDLILIELTKGLNLRQITVLRSLALKINT